MSNKLIPEQHLSFSTLFPELSRVVCETLKRHLTVLQLPCTSPLLGRYIEIITRDAIERRAVAGDSSEVFIDLEEVEGRDLERVDALVIHWCEKVLGNDESLVPRAKKCFPKIFELARDQILLKENTSPLYLSAEDLASLTMLLAYVTATTYRGHDRISNKEAFTKSYEGWFIET